MNRSLSRRQFSILRVGDTVRFGHYSLVMYGFVVENPADGPVKIHGFAGERITTYDRSAITLLHRAYTPASSLRNQTREVTP